MRRRWAPLAASLLVAACTPQTIPTVDDREAPTVSVVAPSGGETVETFTPTIAVSYDDPKSGIRVASFRATINERDYSAEFDHTVRGAKGAISPVRPIPLGRNHLVVEIADRNGNRGVAETDFVNAAGGWLTVQTGPRELLRHVEIVMDASGSMRDSIGLFTRMEVAKDALKQLVSEMPNTTRVGLRVFYDCGSIKSLVPVSKLDKGRFLAKVDGIEPSGGTPLVASLLESFTALRKEKHGERVAVLVTDGAESCSGDIQQAVNTARDASTRVVVIGFDIEGQSLLQTLRELAQNTGGAYFDARSSEELTQVLAKVVRRLGYSVFDADGNVIAQGEVDGEAVEVPTGAVRVRLDTTPAVVVQGVEIGRLTDTVVTVDQGPRRIESRVAAPVPRAL